MKKLQLSLRNNDDVCHYLTFPKKVSMNKSRIAFKRTLGGLSTRMQQKVFYIAKIRLAS